MDMRRHESVLQIHSGSTSFLFEGQHEPNPVTRIRFPSLESQTTPISRTNMSNPANVPVLKLNNGQPFPSLGFGTWSPEKLGERDLFTDAVYEAIKAGYRHIDTAWIYRVEKQVGQAVRRAIDEGIIKREDIVVVTKLWPTNYKPDRVKTYAQESLDNLGLGYIDVLLLHFPVPINSELPFAPNVNWPLDSEGNLVFDDTVDLFGGTWKAMEELVDSGVTKSIGVSNFSVKQIEELVSTARIKPVTNQVECHPLLPQNKLLEVCQKHGIILTAYSPFGGNPRPQADGSFAESDVKKKLFTNEMLKSLAEKYKKSESQILLKFHIKRGCAVIPKSVKKERILQNIDIFDFDLTDDEVKELSSWPDTVRNVRLPGAEKSKYNPYTDD